MKHDRQTLDAAIVRLLEIAEAEKTLAEASRIRAGSEKPPDYGHALTVAAAHANQHSGLARAIRELWHMRGVD